MAKSSTTNLILLAVLGLLGLGIGAKALFSRLGGTRYETGETAEASAALFPDFKKDDVAAVRIEAPDNKTVELVKEGDHWILASEGGESSAGNARADKSDVDRVLGGIEKIKRGKRQSNRLDIIKADKSATITAWKLATKQDPPVAKFTVASIEGEWKFAFLKLPDEDFVRKAEAAKSDFEPGYDNTWRDKTVFDDGPADKIEQIEMAGPKGVIVLAKEKVIGPKAPPGEPVADGTGDAGAEGVDPTTSPPTNLDATAGAGGDTEVKETFWNLTAPTSGRAQTWLMNSVTGQLAKLECDSFFEGKETLAELGLEPPVWSFKVRREGATETKTVLLMGNKNADGKYPVKLPDQPQVWWVASWKGEYLTKSPDELLEKKPEEPKPAGAADPVGDPVDDHQPAATEGDPAVAPAAGDPPAGDPAADGSTPPPPADKPKDDGAPPASPPAAPEKPKSDDGGN